MFIESLWGQQRQFIYEKKSKNNIETAGVKNLIGRMNIFEMFAVQAI